MEMIKIVIPSTQEFHVLRPYNGSITGARPLCGEWGPNYVGEALAQEHGNMFEFMIDWIIDRYGQPPDNWTWNGPEFPTCLFFHFRNIDEAILFKLRLP